MVTYLCTVLPFYSSEFDFSESCVSMHFITMFSCVTVLWILKTWAIVAIHREKWFNILGVKNTVMSDPLIPLSGFPRRGPRPLATHLTVNKGQWGPPVWNHSVSTTRTGILWLAIDPRYQTRIGAAITGQLMHTCRARTHRSQGDKKTRSNRKRTRSLSHSPSPVLLWDSPRKRTSNVSHEWNSAGKVGQTTSTEQTQWSATGTYSQPSCPNWNTHLDIRSRDYFKISCNQDHPSCHLHNNNLIVIASEFLLKRSAFGNHQVPLCCWQLRIVRPGAYHWLQNTPGWQGWSPGLPRYSYSHSLHEGLGMRSLRNLTQRIRTQSSFLTGDNVKFNEALRSTEEDRLVREILPDSRPATQRDPPLDLFTQRIEDMLPRPLPRLSRYFGHSDAVHNISELKEGGHNTTSGAIPLSS